MHLSFFRPNYVFNNDAYFYFLDFRSQKFSLIFFNANPFKHQQALHFWVLNNEKQHKEGTCKVSGRSVVFSAFYADFCLCPKLVIIATLSIASLTKSCIVIPGDANSLYSWHVQRTQGPEVIQFFFMLKLAKLFNVKMPTIVGILTFMSRKNSISIMNLSGLEKR